MTMTSRRVAFLAAGALVVLVGVVGAACGSGSSGGGGGSGSAASLEGTSWRLTGWSNTGQNPNDFTITAEFKDGRIGGTSAVNQYGGPYKAGDDGSFSVGDLVSTMMAGPEPAMRAEKTYVDLLSAMTSFTIDDGTLTLTHGSDHLVFTRSSASPSP
jgi:heat shock protein HslJ